MPLPHRKRQTKKPTSLPKDFLRTVSKLFQKQFADQLNEATFLVYGDLFPNEAVLCVSLAHPKSLRAASMHLSTDLGREMSEQPDKVTERLKCLVDVAASWFSQCFQSGSGLDAVLAEMAEIDPSWQEFEWEGQTVFVMLNRTNYTLEKAANDFLKKSGFTDEEDDEEFDLDALVEDDDFDPKGPLN